MNIVVGNSYKCKNGMDFICEKFELDEKYGFDYFGKVYKNGIFERIAFIKPSGRYKSSGESEFDLVVN